MRQAVKSKHLWIGFALLTLFFISARFIPNPILLLLTNSFQLCASIAVGLVYIPVTWRLVRDPAAPPRAVAISLGICYAWNFGSLWRVISLLWLTSGQDPVVVNNDIVAMCQSGIAFGALQHLTTIDYSAKRTLQWSMIGSVIGATLLLAFTLAVLHPDTRGLVNALAPYIPR